MVREALKKTLPALIVAGLAAGYGCSRDYAFPEVDVRIELDGSNTYREGEPVTFLFEGDYDNISFFSGEEGRRYCYKDRHNVTVEEVESAVLTVRYQARYGSPGGLDLYVSSDFEGLLGNDGKKDRETLEALEAGIDPETYEISLPGWRRLDYNEDVAMEWTSQTYDISDYIEGFCFAFFWHPTIPSWKTQRTYWLDPSIEIDIKDAPKSHLDLNDIGGVGVFMNEEYDAYKGSGDPSVSRTSYSAPLVFQGAAKDDFRYRGWFVSPRLQLSLVENDRGEIIKNIQSPLPKFTHTYSGPGTYTATFIVSNTTIQGESVEVKEFTINILPRIDIE